MEYRRLGSSGLKVSALALGSWMYGAQVDEDTASACLLTAYDLGVNFFDTADVYGEGNAEGVLGRAFKDLRRESLVISTKVFWGRQEPNQIGLSRKHIMEACHSSLKRLGMDYVDLYFCHWFDPEAPIEEIVRAMDDLVHQGKVLYWGTSSWPGADVMQAYSVARQYGLYPPQMEQPQYNLFERERVEKDLLRLYKEIGLGLTIWSPLANGLLTGKYNEGIPRDTRAALPGFEWVQERVITAERVAAVRQLAAIAEELGCSLAQLALAWCVKNPNVSSAITGASRPEQVRENLRALDVVPKLTPEVMQSIEAVVADV